MSHAKIIVLLAFFLILVLISVSSVYYSYQIPETEKHTTLLWNYQHTGNYDYTANLTPNVIYNKTTLSPGEGPIYLRITESMNFSFTYVFQSSREVNATIQYFVQERLQSYRWNMLLNSTTATTISDQTTNRTEIQVDDVPPIIVSDIESLASQLNQEVGVYISDYNATITTQIQITTEYDNQTISELFTPTLSINFRHGTAEGELLVIQGLQSTTSGNKTQETMIQNDWVVNQRYGAYALTTGTVIGSALTTRAYIKTRPRKQKKSQKYIEDIIEPYEEIIAEISEEPAQAKTTATLTMKSLEDLVKTADTLSKPIFHVQKTENNHVFYIVDEATRYEYTAVAPTKATKRAATEEED